LMVYRRDRVQVWASQLAANDFPPICAMTGRPAETWRRFRFATPPTWAYALLLLVCLGGIGFIAFAIVMAAIAQRASGHLPLTHGSRRLVNLVFWTPLALLGLWILLWTAAWITGRATSDPTLTTIAWVMFWVGLLALAGGLVGRLIVTALVGPRGKVMEPPPGHIDKLVELRNVHPAFVAAVRQIHATWAAQASRPN
jgi:hypothetical protein